MKHLTALTLLALVGCPPPVTPPEAPGADVDARTIHGWTALMLAAWKDHPAIAALLKAAGAKE